VITCAQKFNQLQLAQAQRGPIGSIGANRAPSWPLLAQLQPTKLQLAPPNMSPTGPLPMCPLRPKLSPPPPPATLHWPLASRAHWAPLDLKRATSGAKLCLILRGRLALGHSSRATSGRARARSVGQLGAHTSLWLVWGRLLAADCRRGHQVGGSLSGQLAATVWRLVFRATVSSDCFQQLFRAAPQMGSLLRHNKRARLQPPAEASFLIIIKRLSWHFGRFGPKLVGASSVRLLGGSNCRSLSELGCGFPRLAPTLSPNAWLSCQRHAQAAALCGRKGRPFRPAGALRACRRPPIGLRGRLAGANSLPIDLGRPFGVVWRSRAAEKSSLESGRGAPSWAEVVGARVYKCGAD